MADIEDIFSTATFVFLLFFVQGFRSSFGQSDPLYVAVVRSPVATTASPTIIEVYRGDGSGTASVEFDKAELVFMGVSTYQFRENSPSVPNAAMIDTSSEPATLTLPVTMTTSERTGIYTITVTEDGESAIWRVLVTNVAATIRALEYSTVASSGDDVTVSAEADSNIPMTSLRWRRNGNRNPLKGGSSCFGEVSCGDDSAAAGTTAVFECHRGGYYPDQVHAIMSVVVRECEEDMWDPPGCSNVCQPCINGGVCSDRTGWCLCPPGFSGNHCENIHGRNVFGQNAEYKCDNSGDVHDTGCQGAMICYPRPFGCICPAGYTGLDCMHPCSTGMFGANCKQQCHCTEDFLCALDTGQCDNGVCESGWKGVNCQLVVCSVGIYGDFCNNNCSCEAEDCSEVEANCADGCTVPWTGSACDQNGGPGNITLSYVRVNPGQSTSVTCSVIRNPLVAESDLILNPAGTPCTDCDDQNSDRSYNQTKTVMITLNDEMEVNCSVRGIDVMETITLTPYVIMEARPSAVYLVALVIPFLILFILVVVIFKRFRGIAAADSKPVDVQDGVTDDPEDYIALEEQSRNKPAPKYQDVTQTAEYETAIVETSVTSPKAMPRQGINRQSNYQYEDVNVDADARKLPSVPKLHQQSEDETEYEYPELLEEYAGVDINTHNAVKPAPPTPIKVAEFKTFMSRERSEVIRDIIQQFMALQSGKQHPWTAALKLQNKPKNFFKALLPYDHSRVRMDTDGSDASSDYINASYIKNHQGKVSFIAAQGPRDGTKDDFWRMVWQEDVETIVMLVDKAEITAEQQYWPSKVNTSLQYGDITVLLMESTGFRTHTIRKMNVLKGAERVHILRQYEVPCWKYGGVPSESADLISVIKQIKTHQKGNKQLLVHCSNGVGATGTFITLYDLMDVIKTKKEVSVFDDIAGMRKDRVNMVLTKLQYLFIFDALLEVMLSPDSQMSCDQLKKLNLPAMKKKSKQEFQILQETTKQQENLTTLTGHAPENSHKNRFEDLLPADKHKPVLKSPGSLFGANDYINATSVKGVSGNDFIMTQSPLTSIVEDFWRLVFDYNCTTIVMLNTIDDSDESLTEYWPNGHNAAASHGLMTIVCKKMDESDAFTRRQFEVNHKRSQKSILVDHFSFDGWIGDEPDVNTLREFIKYTKTKGSGPGVVHCINGVGLSAVYVTVTTELERMEKEGTVDVFLTVNRLRKKCPHAVQTEEEYLLCYQLLRDHLNNPEEYAVVY